MCLAPNAWMSCSRHRRRSACAPAPPSGRSTAICTSTRRMATCTGAARPAGCGSTWTIAARSRSTSRASADRLERVTALRAAPPAIARQAAVVAVAHGRLALWSSGAALRLPLEDGGGEEACRRAMRRVFGNVEGEVRLLGVVPAADRRPTIEVWLVRRLRRDLTAIPPGGLQWFAPQDIVARVGSPVLRDAVTLSALAVAARSDLVPESSAAPLVENSPANRGTTDETSRLTLSELRVPTLPAKTLDAARPAADQFINNLLSAAGRAASSVFAGSVGTR